MILQKSLQVDERCSKVNELNTTYFFKNHEILFKYFDEETQTPWKHAVFSTCEVCISYFGEPATVC